MRSVCLAFLALAALPEVALAFEPTQSAVANALLASLEDGAYDTAAAGSVTLEGDMTVLRDVSARAANSTAAMTAAIVRIEGAVVDAKNALVAARLTYEDAAIVSSNGDRLGFASIVVEDTRTAADGETSGVLALLGAFDRIILTGVESRTASGDALTVDAVSVALGERNAAEALAGEATVEGLAFDTAIWQEPLASQMKALGYTRMNVTIRAKGRWAAATGSAVVEDFAIRIADLGALDISLSADGLTAAAITGMTTKVEDATQLMALMETIKLSAVTVTYTDEGIAGLLLDQLAQRAGVPRPTLVQGIVSTLPQALAVIEDEALIGKIVTAAAAFLTEPGTLTLRAVPAAPVSATEIVGAAIFAPASLPTILDLEISTAP